MTSRTTELRPVDAFTKSLRQSTDPMGMVLASSPGRGELGEDLKKNRVLEIACTWGPTVLQVWHLDGTNGRFVLGVDAPLPEGLLPDGPHELFSCSDEALMVDAMPDWPITLRRDGDALTASSTMQIPDGGQVVVEVGEFVFIARVVRASRKVQGGARLDVPFLGFASFAVFLATLGGIFAYNTAPASVVTENQLVDRMASLELMEPPTLPSHLQEQQHADQEEGERHEGDEGKAGAEDGDMAQAKGTPRPGDDKEIAESAGIFGISGGSLDAMFGDGVSGGLSDSLGSNAIGAKGRQIGVGGWSTTGKGPGGGGPVGSMTGGVGTKGKGQGYGQQDMGPRPGGVVPSFSDGGIIMGGMDASLIDAVIKRNLNQIRYCYQRELTKNPDLGGKVTVKFVIAKDGSVSAASTKSSSIGNAAVESCVNGRIMRLQFPEPQGGGIVIVSYPFVFSPG